MPYDNYGYVKSPFEQQSGKQHESRIMLKDTKKHNLFFKWASFGTVNCGKYIEFNARLVHLERIF